MRAGDSVLFAIIFVVIVMFGFLIAAVQLFRGKWLRLIAGNTFGDVPKKTAKKAGRIVGWLLIAGILFMGLLILDFVFHIFSFVINIILIVITVAAFYVIFSYLRHWIKNGE